MKMHRKYPLSKGLYVFNYVFQIEGKPLIKMSCLNSLFTKFKLYETT